jgi:hypothetical protein
VASGRSCYPQKMDAEQSRGPGIRLGLCADCRHARRIESERGSAFLRCELGLTDSRFPKYPRLPVLACSGHQKNTVEHTESSKARNNSQ